MRIAELFRITRLAKGIKQFQLADLAGISVSAFARFEGNKLGLSNDTLLRIAPYLDINPEYVVGNSDYPFLSTSNELIKFFVDKFHFHDDPILAMIRSSSTYLEYYSLTPHLSVLERIRHLNIADKPTYALLVKDGMSNNFIFRCKSNKDFMTWNDVHISRDTYFMKITNKQGWYDKVTINRSLYEKILQWDDICISDFEQLFEESKKNIRFKLISKEQEADIINELREHHLDMYYVKKALDLIGDLQSNNIDPEEARAVIKSYYKF